MTNRKKKKNDEESSDVKKKSLSQLDELKQRIRLMSSAEKRKLAKETGNPAILALLAGDKDENVRDEVAKNRNCQQETLNTLIDDRYVKVRIHAVFTSRYNLMMNSHQREIAYQKLSGYIREYDTDHNVDLANLNNLYHGKSDNVEKDLNKFRNQVSEIIKDNREMSEMEKFLAEGIYTGSQLSGADLSAIDLEIALATGHDVDGIDIPFDTPEERNPEMTMDIVEPARKRDNGLER